MIKIQSLNKAYGSKQILTNINLHFNKGDINGIVGENGAGKTTLFKCISGLESFDGNIEFDNGILKNVTGFLTTDPYFLTKITGKEYLQLFCNARNVTITDFEEKNIFDLPLNQYADTYSTGMKKKLALTAILLQKNEVFILDEPFNGVDIQSNIVIKEIVYRSSFIVSGPENFIKKNYLIIQDHFKLYEENQKDKSDLNFLKLKTYLIKLLLSKIIS